MTVHHTARNTIQKQYLHVEFHGVEAEGFTLQQKLSDLSAHRLTPAIERVLDRYSPQDELISIENIRLDIGPLSASELEVTLPGLVALAVERELYRLFSTGTSSSGHFAEGIRRRTAKRYIEEVFIYYLKTGTLPWSFSALSELPDSALILDNPKSPASPVSFINDRIGLEKMILAAWEKTGNSGQAPLDNRDEIVRELAGDTARKRLVRQFSPKFLRVLLPLLSHEALQEVEKALSAIRHLRILPEENAAFERLVWETAFSLVAAGRPFSAWDIVTGTYFLLALGRKQLNASLKVLHRYLPEAVIPEEQDDYSGSTGSGYVEPDVNAGPELHRSEFERPHHNVGAGSKDGRLERTSPEQPGKSPAEAVKPQTHRNTGVAKSRAGTAKTGAVGRGVKSKHINPALKDSDNLKASPVETAPEIQGKPVSRKNVRRAGTTNAKNSLVSLRGTSSIDHGPHPEAAEGLYIGNAGLVVLHPFLSQFFTGLGIAIGNELVKPERALCLLHYLATGSDVAPEYDLVLPKIMCNVPLTEPVESQVNLTTAEKAEAEALLQTVIRYWDALRNTSPDGLRSAFLLRQGKIALKDAGWILRVEPKGFDILLGSLPWGLSMVKLPWMYKFLHVEW